ncbi:MAG: hypothetical protein KatS3mg014_2618 [Actinomycetota bacterium]|nr:MAG: hypothetical protein KatS3mg014_2618 [Actinomycetota bacterium]
MFCTECGRELVGGACPVHGAPRPSAPAAGVAGARSGRGRAPIWVAGAALLLAAGAAAGSIVASTSARRAAQRVERLAQQIERVASGLEEQRAALQGITARTERLARGLEEGLDAEAVARDASPAVFLVETGAGQGSGFVVRSRRGGSTLLTNFHVVRDAWESGTAVTLRQGDRTYRGSVVAVSRAEDLAAISVPVRLPRLELARHAPRAGEPVVVVGSPLGLEHTVVTGVVSGQRERYLQISAPLSPGDSGAPVLDASGRVVGVAVSKVVGVDVEGISFAIPVETVCLTVLRC